MLHVLSTSQSDILELSKNTYIIIVHRIYCILANLHMLHAPKFKYIIVSYMSSQIIPWKLM